MQFSFITFSVCVTTLKTNSVRRFIHKVAEVERWKCPCHHLYFQPVQSINYMLAVFEKLYKYAKESDDKIPIKICEVRQSESD